MSMIIESLPFKRVLHHRRRTGDPDCRSWVLRCSALTCGAGWLVPVEIAGPFARYRVQRARSIAGALKGLERFATHGGIDVEVRHGGNGAKLLEHEEDGAVVHQAAPVASPNQVSLFFGQPSSLETCFRIAKERLSVTRLDHPVQVVVDAERFYAALERERVGAFEPLDAGELTCHVASVALDDGRVGRVRAFVDRGRDAGHRWEVIASVLAFDVRR